MRILRAQGAAKNSPGKRIVARLRRTGDIAMALTLEEQIARPHSSTATSLLDLSTEGARWSSCSTLALPSRLSAFDVINLVIFAEVSIRYPRIDELDSVLPKADFDREPIPFEPAFLAGKVFDVSTARRRHAILPALFIGAHAGVAGYRLPTRNTPVLSAYSRTVPLIAPN